MTITRVPAEKGVAHRATPRRPPIGPRIIGGLLLAVGVFLFVRAIQSASEDGVALRGPRLAPIVVTGAWVLISAVYLVRQLVAPDADYPPTAGEADTAEPVDGPPPIGDRRHGTTWSTPLLLAAALVGYAFVLRYTIAGYVVATAGFFIVAARLLGNRPVREVILRDVLVAVGLAITIYLVFTRLLDISLPRGVFPL